MTKERIAELRDWIKATLMGGGWYARNCKYVDGLLTLLDAEESRQKGEEARLSAPASKASADLAAARAEVAALRSGVESVIAAYTPSMHAWPITERLRAALAEAGEREEKVKP